MKYFDKKTKKNNEILQTKKTSVMRVCEFESINTTSLDTEELNGSEFVAKLPRPL